MIINIGTLDRWLRVALGVAMLCLVSYGPHSDWGWLGIVPLLTGIFGFCPLYGLMGWNTARGNVRHS